MHKAVLCLDSGTTRVKAAVYSTAGELLGFAEAENTALVRNGSHLTQDMETTRVLNLSVVRECIRNAGVPISAMILSAQGDGLWALDKARNPYMDGIVWLDGRAKDVLSRLERDGILNSIRGITLSKPTSASQTILMRWLKENSPVDYERLGYALRLKDWLFFALTGELMTETSNILPIWGDPRKGLLSRKIPELLGLEKGIEVVPEVRDVRHCHAMLRREVANSLGINYTFPVYLGPSDVQATAIGLGVGFRTGINSCSVFGTASIHVGYASSPAFWKEIPPGCFIQPYALLPGFVCLHPGLNGAGTFKHIDKLTNNTATQNREIVPAESDLLVLPFFEEGGERAPFTNPNAQGAIFGLKASSTPEQIRWAAREALAFLGRISQDMLYAENIVAVGGGLSQDKHFMQFYADCLGRELHCFESANVGLYGLALLLISVLDHEAFNTLRQKPLGSSHIYRPRYEVFGEIDRKFNFFKELATLSLKFSDAYHDEDCAPEDN